jgi:hypothetical protein
MSWNRLGMSWDRLGVAEDFLVPGKNRDDDHQWDEDHDHQAPEHARPQLAFGTRGHGRGCSVWVVFKATRAVCSTARTS